MVVTSIIIGIFLLFIEGRNLIKQKEWKEIVVVISIICLAIVLSVFQSLGFKTPLQIIESWITPLGKFIMK